MAICSPRHLRTASSLSVLTSWPSTSTRAGVDRAVGRQVAQRGHGQRGLAAARLADEAVGLAALDAQGDALEHRQVAAAAMEGDLEVADVERGGRCVRGVGRLLHGAHFEKTLPSPSVMRLTPTTREARAAAGNSTVHGAICRKTRSVAMVRPQSGEGGAGRSRGTTAWPP